MKTKSVELRSSAAARKWEYIDKNNLFAINLNPIVLLISRLTLPRLPGPNLTNGQLRVSLPPVSVSRWSRVSGPVSPSRVLLCHAASRSVTPPHSRHLHIPDQRHRRCCIPNVVLTFHLSEQIPRIHLLETINKLYNNNRNLIS